MLTTKLMASLATSYISSLPTSPFHRSTHWSPHRAAPPPVATAKATMPAMASASQGPQLLEAAKHAVDNYVKSGMVVGLGSGNASGMAIQYMGRLMKAGNLKNIVGIPMSVSSASEAAKAGIPLDNYQENLQIDFAFDDADVIEEGSLAAVIGRRKLEGRESILQEKSIIEVAKNLVFIINEKQYVRDFEGSIPVVIKTVIFHLCKTYLLHLADDETIYFQVNWLDTAEEIDDLFLGDAEMGLLVLTVDIDVHRIKWSLLKVWRRASFGHADPLGGDFPLVTNEGHHILDIIFTSPILNLSHVAESLDQIVGVVDHGLVVDVPCAVVIALQDGLQIVDNMSINTMKGT